jgi:hypothetical protein
LKNIQNGGGSFKAVVSISSLQTRSEKALVTAPEPLECGNIGTIQVIKPPSLSAEDIED